MDFNSFLALLKKELAIEVPVSPDTILQQSSWWDSMSVLDVIAFMDRDFQISLNFEEFKTVKTVNDLFVYITSKSPEIV